MRLVDLRNVVKHEEAPIIDLEDTEYQVVSEASDAQIEEDENVEASTKLDVLATPNSSNVSEDIPDIISSITRQEQEIAQTHSAGLLSELRTLVVVEEEIALDLPGEEAEEIYDMTGSQQEQEEASAATDETPSDLMTDGSIQSALSSTAGLADELVETKVKSEEITEEEIDLEQTNNQKGQDAREAKLRARNLAALAVGAKSLSKPIVEDALPQSAERNDDEVAPTKEKVEGKEERHNGVASESKNRIDTELPFIVVEPGVQPDAKPFIEIEEVVEAKPTDEAETDNSDAVKKYAVQIRRALGHSNFKVETKKADNPERPERETIFKTETKHIEVEDDTRKMKVSSVKNEPTVEAIEEMARVTVNMAIQRGWASLKLSSNNQTLIDLVEKQAERLNIAVINNSPALDMGMEENVNSLPSDSDADWKSKLGALPETTENTTDNMDEPLLKL